MLETLDSSPISNKIILSDTFDPIHEGHIKLGKAVQRVLKRQDKDLIYEMAVLDSESKLIDENKLVTRLS